MSKDTSGVPQRHALLERTRRLQWPDGVTAAGVAINANPRSWQRRINNAPPAELDEIERQLNQLEARAARLHAVEEELDRRRASVVQAAADAEETRVEQALQRRSLRRTIERALSEASVRSSARRKART